MLLQIGDHIPNHQKTLHYTWWQVGQTLQYNIIFLCYARLKPFLVLFLLGILPTQEPRLLQTLHCPILKSNFPQKTLNHFLVQAFIQGILVAHLLHAFSHWVQQNDTVGFRQEFTSQWEIQILVTNICLLIDLHSLNTL